MGGRIGRAHTTMVRAKFGIDNVAGYTWVPGQNTSVAGTAFTGNQELPAFVTNGSGNQACVYQFGFDLSLLAANNPGYTTYAAAFDQYKITACGIQLRCSIDPRRMLTQALSTSATNQYNFSGELQMDPDVTWIDRDGSLAVNSTSSYALPANGDCSDEVGNRTGSRTHRAFSTISRWIKPKAVVAMCNSNTGTAYGAPPLLSGLMYGQTNLNPWRGVAGNNAYLGSIFLAVSYKGPNLTANVQPSYAWSCRTMWRMLLRAPLYG